MLMLNVVEMVIAEATNLTRQLVMPAADASLPKGLVYWPIPAGKGTRNRDEESNKTDAKAYSRVPTSNDEIHQRKDGIQA